MALQVLSHQRVNYLALLIAPDFIESPNAIKSLSASGMQVHAMAVCGQSSGQHQVTIPMPSAHQMELVFLW